MPSKKKRATGRAQAADPLANDNDHTDTPSCSSGSKATGSSAPATSASAKLIDSIAKISPSRAHASPSGGFRDIATSSHAVDSRISPKSASSTAAATAVDEPSACFEEPSADEFQDALEELAQGSDDHQADVPEEDPVPKLIAKDPTLQKPVASRVDWEAEMEALRKLMEDAGVSEDEKVRVLHEALTQRVEDLRNLEEHKTATERGLEEIKKEKERCRKEANAAQATKAKLEESCRELQQLKGSIAVESKKIVEDERERQTELNSKFETAMKDVEEKMNAESEVREHFIKENEELRSKLEKFTETYEEQERQLSEQNAVRTKEMEAARDRLKEYETKSADSSVNATNLEKKNKVLQKTTATLRTELQSILGKFDEFHESVNGSNKKHGECKEEIDVLSAKLKDLDADNLALKNNDEVNALTKEKESAQKQCEALEKLITNLQREVDAARERLRKNGGC